MIPAGFAHAESWGTSFGDMELPDSPRAGPLRAPYSSDQGRIIGRMDIPKCMGCGPVVTGVWVEQGSSKKCESPQDGSHYWGNVELEFTGPYDSFTGKWDYCGDGSNRSWTGKLGARSRSGGAGH
jgi:hypothetical protein